MKFKKALIENIDITWKNIHHIHIEKPPWKYQNALQEGQKKKNWNNFSWYTLAIYFTPLFGTKKKSFSDEICFNKSVLRMWKSTTKRRKVFPELIANIKSYVSLFVPFEREIAWKNCEEKESEDEGTKKRTERKKGNQFWAKKQNENENSDLCQMISI